MAIRYGTLPHSDSSHVIFAWYKTNSSAALHDCMLVCEALMRMQVTALIID